MSGLGKQYNYQKAVYSPELRVKAVNTVRKPSKLDLLKRIEQNIGKQHG